MSESWRPVIGWEGRYEVSSAGRVRSVSRCGVHGREKSRVFPSKLLTPIVTAKGYLVVNFTDNAVVGVPRRRVQRKIHHLVLEAFIGPKPPETQGCHNNGIKEDCRLSNLRWDTAAGNCADKIRHGTVQCGERNGNAKLTSSLVAMIRSSTESSRTLAKSLGISKTNVLDIRSRATWGHIV